MSAPRQFPLFILAMDHRQWFEEQVGATPAIISAFKAKAASTAATELEKAGFGAQAGFILDDQFGRQALAHVEGAGFWTAEPIEQSAVTPLALLDEPVRFLENRPVSRTVKLLVFDPDAVQLPNVQAVQAACQARGQDFLLEVIMRQGDLGVAARYLHDHGIRPEWWKVTAGPGLDVVQEVAAASSSCRGVLLLGGGEPIETLHSRWAAVEGPFAGCAVGRTVFGQAFLDHLKGQPLADAAAQVVDRFLHLVRGFPVRVH